MFPKTIRWTGAVWLLVGIGLLGVAGVSGDPRPDLLHTQLPRALRVVIWAVPGLLAMLAAHLTRLVPIILGALVIGPINRIFSYAWSWILWILDPNTGSQTGWYHLLFYVVALSLIWLLARLPNPPERP
mgnify:CR=1 FL=1